MMKNEDIYIGCTKDTSLGDVWVAISERGLVSVDYPSTESRLRERLSNRYSGDIITDQQRVANICQQVWDYLCGELTSFDVTIDWTVCTPFQEKVLKNTLEIPRGETRSYGEVAALAGSPKAARAVGRAQATNPIPLIIPCHRVIGADGGLHGYGGGTDGLPTKEWLLKLEGAR